MRLIRLLATALAAATGLPCVASAQSVPPADDWKILKDTNIKPGEYRLADRGGDGAIRVQKGDLTLDGHGAVLDGGNRSGIGIVIEGVENVVIKNITIKNFKTGIHALKVTNLTLENVDCSGNYTNSEIAVPATERAGGFLLENTNIAHLTSCTASQNWNGFMVFDSAQVEITKSRAENCNNVGVQITDSRQTIVRECTLLRCERIPGDSRKFGAAGIALEGGSRASRIYNNILDGCTDGIAIRARGTNYNEWNAISNNKISNARSIGIECSGLKNHFSTNEISRCGTGALLRGADHCTIAENRIFECGKGGADAPAGGAIIGDAGAVGLRIVGNNISKNTGPGILLNGASKEFPFTLVTIQSNILESNSAGIVLNEANLIDIRGNQFKDNEQKPEVIFKKNVSDVLFKNNGFLPTTDDFRFYISDFPRCVAVGESIQIKATDARKRPSGKISFHHDFGDGATATGSNVEHAYRKPGFYRIGILGEDLFSASLRVHEIYVLTPGADLSEIPVARWAADSGGSPSRNTKITEDPETKLKGKSSIHVVTDSADSVNIYFPKTRDANWNVTGKKSIQLLLKYINKNEESFENHSPAIRIHDERPRCGEKSYIELQPRDNRIGVLAPCSEARRDFGFYEIPLEGNSDWARTTVGKPELSSLDVLEIQCDAAGAGFELWIDGVQFVK